MSMCQSRPKTSMEYFPCRFILKAIRLLLGVHPIPITISPSGYSAQHFEYFLIGLYQKTILPCPPKILPVFSRQRHSAVYICSLTSTPYRGYLSTSNVKIVFFKESPMPFIAENAYLPQRMRQLSESFSKVMRVSFEWREMRQQVGLQQTNRQGFWTINLETGHQESLILMVLSGRFFCSKSNLSIRYISLLVVRLFPGRLLLLYPPMMYPLLNLQIVKGYNLLILIFLGYFSKSYSQSVRNCPSIRANRQGGINSTMNSYFSLGTLLIDLVRVLKTMTLRTPLQIMWLWQQKNSTIFQGKSIVVFYLSCVEGFQEESVEGDSLFSISPMDFLDYNWGNMGQWTQRQQSNDTNRYSYSLISPIVIPFCIFQYKNHKISCDFKLNIDISLILLLVDIRSQTTLHATAIQFILQSIPNQLLLHTLLQQMQPLHRQHLHIEVLQVCILDAQLLVIVEILHVTDYCQDESCEFLVLEKLHFLLIAKLVEDSLGLGDVHVHELGVPLDDVLIGTKCLPILHQIIIPFSLQLLPHLLMALFPKLLNLT